MLRQKALKEKIAAAWQARSPAIYPALMLALNAGMRDSEIRQLQWGRLDLCDAVLTVGASKTEAGEGRTIPLNSQLLPVIIDYARLYEKRFGPIHPEWYVFPFGKPRPRPYSTDGHAEDFVEQRSKKGGGERALA